MCKSSVQRVIYDRTNAILSMLYEKVWTFIW